MLGSGKINNRKINVIFITENMLPKRICDDFLHLSNITMTTGDNSFSDCLFIKKIIPYYEQQHWKDTLHNVVGFAKSIVGDWFSSVANEANKTDLKFYFGKKKKNILTKNLFRSLTNIEHNTFISLQNSSNILMNIIEKYISHWCDYRSVGVYNKKRRDYVEQDLRENLFLMVVEIIMEADKVDNSHCASRVFSEKIETFSNNWCELKLNEYDGLKEDLNKNTFDLLSDNYALFDKNVKYKIKTSNIKNAKNKIQDFSENWCECNLKKDDKEKENLKKDLYEKLFALYKTISNDINYNDLKEDVEFFKEKIQPFVEKYNRYYETEESVYLGTMISRLLAREINYSEFSDFAKLAAKIKRMVHKFGEKSRDKFGYKSKNIKVMSENIKVMKVLTNHLYFQLIKETDYSEFLDKTTDFFQRTAQKISISLCDISNKFIVIKRLKNELEYKFNEFDNVDDDEYTTQSISVRPNQKRKDPVFESFFAYFNQHLAKQDATNIIRDALS